LRVIKLNMKWVEGFVFVNVPLVKKRRNSSNLALTDVTLSSCVILKNS
jgi:hypothetical protein